MHTNEHKLRNKKFVFIRGFRDSKLDRIDCQYAFEIEPKVFCNCLCACAACRPPGIRQREPDPFRRADLPQIG